MVVRRRARPVLEQVVMTTSAAMSPNAGLEEALSGLRVVAFTGRAADFCGHLLTYLGAHVIKLGPVHSSDDGTNAFALAYDRGKEIVDVDPRSAVGQSRIEELVRDADVVITDLVESGVAPMSYAQLARINAAVIHAEISTFGTSGPSADRSGGDLIATAQSGFLHLTGTPGETPVRMGADQAVKLGGAEAAAGIMVALHHRDRSGEGQHVDVAVRDAMIRATVNAIPKYRYEGVVQQRVGDHWGVREKPLKALWKCRDGWVSFVRRGGALGGRVNRSCVEWMAESGIETGALQYVDWDAIDLGDADDRALIDRLDELFERFLETLDTEQAFKEGLRRGMTLAPVRTLDELLGEEQLATRDYWETVDCANRLVRVPRFVIKTSARGDGAEAPGAGRTAEGDSNA